MAEPEKTDLVKAKDAFFEAWYECKILPSSPDAREAQRQAFEKLAEVSNLTQSIRMSDVKVHLRSEFAAWIKENGL